MKNLPQKLARAIALACRSTMQIEVDHASLRAGGQAVSPSKRDEILAKCAAGEYVEIEVDLLAYEQKAGERNRNSVRFRDGMLVSFGRTGKGTPFLRDHNQHDSLSVGGVVLESKAEKQAEGHYVIRQTVKLTATWAVELALRGLLRAVSIGWRPTGPVLCSVHNAPVYTRCYCWPGDRLTEKADEDGSKRKVRSADGELVVEWIYTEAELIETSQVPIGGVPTAAAEDEVRALRAELAAAEPGFRATSALKECQMDPELLAALVAALSLAPTASGTDVLTAVKKLKGDHATLTASKSILEKDLSDARGKLAVHVEAAQKTEEEGFIRDALSTGRIAPGDEPPWRSLFKLNADEAKTMMAARPIGSVTPVGAKLASGGTPPADPPKPPAPELAATGATPSLLAQMAAQLGLTPEQLAAGVKGAA